MTALAPIVQPGADLPQPARVARRATVRGGACCDRRAPFTAARFASPRPGAARLRLTRRGRVVLVWLPLVAAATGLLVAAGASVAQAGAPQHPHVVVVVQQGDTLWGIARAAAPGTDPRDEIAAIARRNGLTGWALVPGQRLVLP